MLRAAAGALLLGLLGAREARAQAAAPAAPPGGPAPALVVLVTADQLRADYLDRFAPQLTGGLARLVRGGAYFTNAHQDHAITETAPGHASLLSGRFPRSTGIASNWEGVEDATAPVLGARGGQGASPRRFRGTTLVDWLRARDRRVRALAVSAKDRSAILPIGRAREQVFWYAPDGRFTTSRYYARSLPPWVDRFNARRLPQSHAGRTWSPLLDAAAYPEPDAVAYEADGMDIAFPHPMPADAEGAASFVRATPWIDEILLAFALDGVQSLALGAGPQVDVLSVALSGTDFIGHRYGPDSKEMHDQVLRLDRALGGFLDSLYRLRDSTRVAVVFTADHGVGRIPELAAEGAADPPLRVRIGPAVARVRQALSEAGVPPAALVVDGEAFALDRTALRAAGAEPEPLLARLVAELRGTPGVLRADRWADLLRADHAADPIARRWAHQFPERAPIDVVVTLTPGSVWGSGVATHGSPHDYDSHVPLIFYGPAFRPGRHAGFTRSVDIAPTLAAIVGVRPGEKVDGVVLDSALR